ncbi:MAG: CDP-diacylglycerol--serine O-phosphatidyltransferase [Verrucomicrobiae bacterium]|nr:CDP-diacylglycerol--serine O-phosphatidyltransferase [Verrucomicrobiae bacterium]
MAVSYIIKGTLMQTSHSEDWIRIYEVSLILILAAFICDMFDGRVARLGGRESPFGREFDSLADLVSFGVAPALLVFKILLSDFNPKLAGAVAFLYLLCGALRLARFNVVTTLSPGSSTKDFTGFPIPAAAGTVSSITLLMLRLEKHNTELDSASIRLVLLSLVVFLSLMMFSKFKYPSFKAVDWSSKTSQLRLIAIIFFGFLVVRFYAYSLAFVFTLYLIYGFVRPFVPRHWRREIEEADDEKDATLS